jgi:DNA-binding response OmpR family regulator
MKEDTVDLALCDLHMPQKDGSEFISAIRADGSMNSLPIVILSASVFSDHDSKASMDLGATKFLERPIDPQILLTEIASCLDSRPKKDETTGP